jgi:hypothetical protein
MVGDSCAAPPYASIWIDQLRPQPGPASPATPCGPTYLAVEVHCGGVPLGRSLLPSRQSQEQIQIMTSAIGKAATKATTIVEVNALSKFSSWRTLSTDILLAPPRGSQNAVAGTMP